MCHKLPLMVFVHRVLVIGLQSVLWIENEAVDQFRPPVGLDTILATGPQGPRKPKLTHPVMKQSSWNSGIYFGSVIEGLYVDKKSAEMQVAPRSASCLLMALLIGTFWMLLRRFWLNHSCVLRQLLGKINHCWHFTMFSSQSTTSCKGTKSNKSTKGILRRAICYIHLAEDKTAPNQANLGISYDCQQ